MLTILCLYVQMALTENLQSGQTSEWALMRRHESEDIFGVQITGSHGDQMKRVVSVIRNEVSSNFIDLNCGCPIDLICNRGCGASLLNKQNRLLEMVSTMVKTANRSITVKVRTGWDDKHPNAHKLVPELQKIANDRVAALMIHGRSRLQRYSKLANWEYILEVARAQNPEHKRIPVIGNGDIFSYEDWMSHQALIRQETDDMDEIGLCSCAMIARGAIVKPWLPLEIKEQRHFDISASERLDILQKFCNYGLEHWGSDQRGVNTTRRFLLEWLSFLYKYVPVGLTERTQKINQRLPLYLGRCDTETLLASGNSRDWIKISEMFLGPVSEDFAFVPKHKSNSYSAEPSEAVSNG
jgi:tRNA-dihydrouridine synthase 3